MVYLGARFTYFGENDSTSAGIVGGIKKPKHFDF